MLKIVVHHAGTGTCQLTKKEDVDGFVVTFEDGTVRDAFLSPRALIQLLNMKTPVKPRAKEAVDA
jgi:hypothetical protein